MAFGRLQYILIVEWSCILISVYQDILISRYRLADSFNVNFCLLHMYCTFYIVCGWRFGLSFWRCCCFACLEKTDGGWGIQIWYSCHRFVGILGFQLLNWLERFKSANCYQSLSYHNLIVVTFVVGIITRAFLTLFLEIYQVSGCMSAP